MMNDGAKGTYVLAILIKEDTRINVGVLGGIDFAKGLYAYVGSAQNGLKRRVERHFKKNKRKFWHIDYLLDDEDVKIFEVFYKEAGKMEECKVAEKVSHKSFPMGGFGSSDCKCPSHLFKLKSYHVLEELMRETHMQSEYLVERAKKF
jgi:Uri superfamily endonuclease